MLYEVITDNHRTVDDRLESGVADEADDRGHGLRIVPGDRDPDEGLRPVRLPLDHREREGVITSYSIHYTKLYEPPISEEERAAAEAFRDALERDDEPISGALRALYQARELDGGEHDNLVTKALDERA